MRVDTHMHIYATAEQGLFDTSEYPITEYGDKPDVKFSSRAGTVQDAIDALDAANIDYAAALGSFELPALPLPPESARHWPEDPAFASLTDDLMEYNRWLCQVGAENPRLLPFITVNPAVMTSRQSAMHVADLVDNRGARGMKLHTIGIRTYPDDPGLAGTFEVCQERGIPIVVHCGPDARGYNWSTPASFVHVLENYPRLPLILAHLGGASWREIGTIADDFPQAWFDLSETVHWTDAERGATPAQLTELIASVGVERVMLGSDFPWYEPADTAALVDDLPGLSADERRAILGDNAARLLNLA
jgi:predicted TIM-barrel fold metal-dependent hydrolase